MILEQYYLSCLTHASYLIGDLATRTAVVVDPQRDVDRHGVRDLIELAGGVAA
jgi:hydroxyacylglutathione hydrolase